MFLRVERLLTELPPPSDPDPAGAAAVQELLGGKLRRDVDLLNYTFQSFNFRVAPGRAAVLRPAREHRRGGVRPHRARRGDDQHDAHRRDAGDDGARPRPRSPA